MTEPPNGVHWHVYVREQVEDLRREIHLRFEAFEKQMGERFTTQTAERAALEGRWEEGARGRDEKIVGLEKTVSNVLGHMDQSVQNIRTSNSRTATVVAIIGVVMVALEIGLRLAGH